MTMRQLYPERLAIGFSRADGTVHFYTRVQAVLPSAGTVIDFGAGRGARGKAEPSNKRSLRDLRGQDRFVVGVDVDPIVRVNPYLNDAVVIREGHRLPFEDHSVSLILADHVFEHLADPSFVAAELARLLRSGGWLCARTPNRWGAIGLAARMVPNRYHVDVLRRLQPERQEGDIFTTAYKLNTPKAIRNTFPGFEHHVWGYFPEPAYVGGLAWAQRLASFADRMTPSHFAPVLMAFLRKNT